ncbi:MAG: hypothetical protein EOS63_32120, partial [Mesorhizobium sp.]
MDMIAQNYVGCDISKQWLDFFDETSGRLRRIDNQADAIAAYVAGLDPSRDFVVMEEVSMTGCCAMRWPRPACRS